MTKMDIKAQEVIAHRSQGLSVRKTAAETNLAPSTVQSLSSKHKEIIMATQAAIVERTLPTILDRTIKEINHANTIDPGDKDNQAYLTRVDKKEDSILRACGIAPSAAPSFHINNIYNDNRKEIVSPMIASLLQGKMNDLTEDIPNAEYSDVIE